MPTDDNCKTEFDAYDQKSFEVFAVRCALDDIAFWDYYDAKKAARENCREESLLGSFTPTSEIDLCVENTAAVISALNHYLDLRADCEIAIEELNALLAEYEACRHALESGIPFA